MNPHEYLKSLGVEFTAHSGRTFYEHLCNVELILKVCRQPEYVCLAGLYHSIYGTNYFTKTTTTDRDAIKNVIGEKAERLAYLFCNAHRPYCWFTSNDIIMRDGSFIRVDNQTLHDLRMIEGANLLEQQQGADMIVSFTANYNES